MNRIHTEEKIDIKHKGCTVHIKVNKGNRASTSQKMQGHSFEFYRITIEAIPLESYDYMLI